MKPCFKKAAEIDITISSIGSSSDEHASFTRLLMREKHASTAIELDRTGSHSQYDDLMAQGWIGDAQYLPYSSDAPLEIRNGLRAFVVTTLERLVEMSEPYRRLEAYRSNHAPAVLQKASVLLVGKCGFCDKTRPLRYSCWL